eukprot:TRINITY_DN5272_c0_g1_i1.p1 TRINITY_DN5272_c0_g1~~TRINITY_DN5272_c0_g1_i1.p1  ORF type:complete len:674 (-),score=119.38 TRINITY_DN5272_c0_g1_i1:207-2228(-)
MTIHCTDMLTRAVLVSGLLFVCCLGLSADWMNPAAQTVERSSTTSFGSSVSTLSSFVLVGSSSARKAYLFKRSTANSDLWDTVPVLEWDGTAHEGFGSKVGLTASEAMVVAPAAQKAVFYAYNTDTGEWGSTPKQTVDLSAWSLTDSVGATDGTTFVGSSSAAKKAYIFVRSGTQWSTTNPTAILSYTSVTGFGGACSVNGVYVAIAAPSTKKVYLFRYRLGVWETSAEAVVSGYTGYAGFGSVVFLRSAELFVGSSDVKKVWWFHRTVDGWNTTAQTQFSSAESGFGGAIAYSATPTGTLGTIVIGAPSASKAFLYTSSSTQWTLTPYLSMNTYTSVSSFGASVTAAENDVWIGAPDSKRVYHFSRRGCPASYGNDPNNHATCVACVPGYYSTGTFAAPCTACAAGKSSSASATTCFSCGIGSYSTSGATCMSCPLGTFTTMEGTTKCMSCGTGQYQDEVGKTTCKDCPNGFRNLRPSLKSQGDCEVRDDLLIFIFAGGIVLCLFVFVASVILLWNRHGPSIRLVLLQRKIRALRVAVRSFVGSDDDTERVARVPQRASSSAKMITPIAPEPSGGSPAMLNPVLKRTTSIRPRPAVQYNVDTPQSNAQGLLGHYEQVARCIKGYLVIDRRARQRHRLLHFVADALRWLIGVVSLGGIVYCTVALINNARWIS